MLVPAGVHQLHEAHAALGQPAGHQAVVGEACPAASRRGRTCRARAAARSRSRSAPARSSASGRPSRTGRCAWRSPGRRSRCSFSSLSLARSSSRPRRTSRLMPSGFERYSTGSPLPRNFTPWNLRRQEAAAPVEVVEDLAAATSSLSTRGHDDERRAGLSVSLPRP